MYCPGRVAVELPLPPLSSSFTFSTTLSSPFSCASSSSERPLPAATASLEMYRPSLHLPVPAASRVKPNKMALSHLLADVEVPATATTRLSRTTTPLYTTIPQRLPPSPCHYLPPIPASPISCPSTQHHDPIRPCPITSPLLSTARENHGHFATNGTSHGDAAAETLRYHENEPKSKRPWTEREDELLRALIQRLGVGLWAAIAEHIPSRTGKQVRERWLNHLSPQVFKRPWSPAEDRIIIEAHKLYGNSWSKICKLLDGRSENMCKNRFHCKLSKLQAVSGERDAGARTEFGNLPPRRTLRKY